MPQTNKQTAGQAGEDAALTHLLAAGLTLIERNFQCRWGEIDLILRDSDCLVFVEVRLRSSNQYGGAAASVDQRKQKKLRKTALHYLQRNRSSPNQAARIDVVALQTTPTGFDIDWITNAVEG